MKKLLTLPMILFCMSTHGQNLVPNPSFETFDTCPQGTGKILFATPWFRPTMPVVNTSNDGTSDYFNACFDKSLPWTGYVDVPGNIFGFQNARTGDGYAGFYAFEWGSPPWEYREYIEIKLDSVLLAGVVYYIKFYVSFADSSVLATDDIGLYFSVDSVLSTNYHALPYSPQVVTPATVFLSDRSNWTLIEGTYIALGGEQYITIGNFNDDANTDTLFIPGGGLLNYWNRLSYYFVDDVCISPDSTDCSGSTSGIQPNVIAKIEVYPNPTDDKIFIKAGDGLKTIVSVFNGMGEEVLTERLNSAEAEIDLSKFGEGIYLIKFQIDNNEVVKKIILFKQFKY